MKNLLFAGLLLTATSYGQIPRNAVKKCVVSIDFFDSTGTAKERTRLNELFYYDQAGRLLEERDIARSGGLFSGVRYHYHDSLCIRKEYLGNPTINRNELLLYKNGKMITSLRMENGELQVITDYEYDDHDLESSSRVREYHNGVLISENIALNRYDARRRTIETIDICNGDTSGIMTTRYDSTITCAAPRQVKERKYKVCEVFVHFDSAENKERKWFFYNGEFSFEEERIFDNQHQLISTNNVSNGKVEEEELYSYDAFGRVARHEVIERNRKTVYLFEENMPKAQETWVDGKLFSTVNYTYSPVSKKRN